MSYYLGGRHPATVNDISVALDRLVTAEVALDEFERSLDRSLFGLRVKISDRERSLDLACAFEKYLKRASCHGMCHECSEEPGCYGPPPIPYLDKFLNKQLHQRYSLRAVVKNRRARITEVRKHFHELVETIRREERFEFNDEALRSLTASQHI